MKMHSNNKLKLKLINEELYFLKLKINEVLLFQYMSNLFNILIKIWIIKWLKYWINLLLVYMI